MISAFPRAALFVTDFDGTLYRKKEGIHPRDRDILLALGEEGLCRVIATGRSIASFHKAASDLDLPVDYIVFSSGAGLAEWPSGSIEYSAALSPEESGHIMDVFEAVDLDYMVHDPIPENHRFYFRYSGRENPDFHRRCDVYAEFCSPMSKEYCYRPAPATQIIAILPPGVILPAEVYTGLKDYSVIRATSPLDGTSTWIEVFPKGISKSFGIRRLCERFGIPVHRVCAVGNDYNDLDLLEWAEASFVSPEAPEDMLRLFPVIPDDHGSAISGAIKAWMPLL